MTCQSLFLKNLLKIKKYIKLISIRDDHLFKEINKIKVVNDKIFILDGRLKKIIGFWVRWCFSIKNWGGTW